MLQKISCLSKCETESSERRRFLGRGSETTFRLILDVQRIPPGEDQFVDLECRFWSRLLSRLRFLALLVERNRGFQQRAGIIRYLRNSPHLRSMILKTDLDAWQRGLSELLHRHQLVTQGTLNPAMVFGDVVAFQKRETRRSDWESKFRIQTMVPQFSREGCSRCPCFLEEGRLTSPDPRHFQRQTGEMAPTSAQRCP